MALGQRHWRQMVSFRHGPNANRFWFQLGNVPFERFDRYRCASPAVSIRIHFRLFVNRLEIVSICELNFSITIVDFHLFVFLIG